MPPTHIRPSEGFIYDTTTSESVRDIDGDDYNDEFLEENAKNFDRGNIGSVASPYVMYYVYKRRFLDTHYGIIMDGDICKIGDLAVVIHIDGDITIKEEFRWSECLGKY